MNWWQCGDLAAQIKLNPRYLWTSIFIKNNYFLHKKLLTWVAHPMPGTKARHKTAGRFVIEPEGSCCCCWQLPLGGDWSCRLTPGGAWCCGIIWVKVWLLCASEFCVGVWHEITLEALCWWLLITDRCWLELPWWLRAELGGLWDPADRAEWLEWAETLVADW